MDRNIKANYFKTFIYTSLAFGIGMGLLFTLLRNTSNAIELGVFAGLMFGGVITLITAILESRIETIQKQFLGDKPVVLRGSANHLITGEAAGGRLFLTKDSLRFISHNFNFRNHERTILLADIESINKFNMFGIVPNGMRIITKNGHDSFVINNRNRWIREIKARITS